MLQEQYGFAAKMRNQTIEQLKALETWVERQATGLDMAANPESLRQSFDKLLKVFCMATQSVSAGFIRHVSALDNHQSMHCSWLLKLFCMKPRGSPKQSR